MKQFSLINSSVFSGPEKDGGRMGMSRRWNGFGFGEAQKANPTLGGFEVGESMKSR